MAVFKKLCSKSESEFHLENKSNNKSFEVDSSQCDQIGQFLHFGQPFKAGGNNNFTQITCIVRHFCKGVKIIHFCGEIIFGQLK